MTSNSAKPERKFALLPSNLTQLVDDRLDEEQYDQAVELLDQLCTHAVRPNHSQLRKLFALSLCSLALEQLGSTVPWTHDHQHQRLVARSLIQPVEKGGNALQSATRSSDRPSDTAVLQATSLLLKYSSSLSVPGSVRTTQQLESNAALSRHILNCLPSQLLSQTRSDSNGRSKVLLTRSKQESSAGLSAMTKWIEENLMSAEDIWEVLGAGNSSSSSTLDSEFRHEFWMDDKDQKRYEKQIMSQTSNHKHLEVKLAELQGRKSHADLLEDSSDEASDYSSSSDSPKSLVMPKRGKTATTTTASKSQSQRRPAMKKRRIEQSTAHEQEQARLRLTEGAWRTLLILLKLWEHTAKSKHLGNELEGSLLLCQFKRSQFSQNSTSRRNGTTFPESTDQIDRALDVALSFPQVLAPFKSDAQSHPPDVSSKTSDKSANLNDGSQRLISKVAQSELEHRQRVAVRLQERHCVQRAETAATLLIQMYELVKLKQLQHAAFVEGCAERFKHLTTDNIKRLCIPLASQEPLLAVKVLIACLNDSTMRHPDDLRSSSKGDFCFHLEGEPLIVQSFFAVAVPSDPHSLQNAPGEEDHSEAATVRTFLQQKKISLSSDFLAAYPLTFPSKKEYLAEVDEDSKHNRASLWNRHQDDGVYVDKLLVKAKADKLKALAYARFRQLDARNRVNELKFVVAKCIGDLVNTARQRSSTTTKELSSILTNLPGSSDSAIQSNESYGAADEQRKLVSRLLSQLVKAYDKDCKDFTACLLAMRTHIGVLDLQAEEESRPKDGEGLKRSGAEILTLPTLQLSITRCQKVLRNTENLAHACRILREVALGGSTSTSTQ